jgi:Protein of unknown function (DUF1573)
MNKNVIFGLLALTTIFVSCKENTEVEVGKKTTMSVNEVFDAGKVIKGEKINAEFKVKNTGDYPLVIGGVSPSCGCTVADTPEDPILPGKTAVIRAYVDTDQTSAGAISKSITITANTAPSSKEIKVKALVVNK